MPKQKEKRKFSPMPRRAALFWDVDPKTIDPKKHAKYVIERILDVGNERELRWLTRRYSQCQIRSVAETSRGVLHKKSKALWSLVFK